MCATIIRLWSSRACASGSPADRPRAAIERIRGRYELAGPLQRIAERLPACGQLGGEALPLPPSIQGAPVEARGICMRVALRRMFGAYERVPPCTLPITREEVMQRKHGGLRVDVAICGALQGSPHRRMQSRRSRYGSPS